MGHISALSISLLTFLTYEKITSITNCAVKARFEANTASSTDVVQGTSPHRRLTGSALQRHLFCKHPDHFLGHILVTLTIDSYGSYSFFLPSGSGVVGRYRHPGDNIGRTTDPISEDLTGSSCNPRLTNICRQSQHLQGSEGPRPRRAAEGQGE